MTYISLFDYCISRWDVEFLGMAVGRTFWPLDLWMSYAVICVIVVLTMAQTTKIRWQVKIVGRPSLTMSTMEFSFLLLYIDNEYHVILIVITVYWQWVPWNSHFYYCIWQWVPWNSHCHYCISILIACSWQKKCFDSNECLTMPL